MTPGSPCGSIHRHADDLPVPVRRRLDAARLRALPLDPLQLGAVPAPARGVPRHGGAAVIGGRRLAHAVPGVHDRPGRVDRHGQHRRRGHGHHLGRSGRALLDLDVRPGRHLGEVHRSGAGRALSRGAGRLGAGRADVLPARRLEVARAGQDLCARRRHRRPHHHALHAAQLDCARARQRVRRAHVDRRPRDCGARVGGDHPRHQVDRQGGAGVCRRSRSASTWPVASRSS